MVKTIVHCLSAGTTLCGIPVATTATAKDLWLGAVDWPHFDEIAHKPLRGVRPVKCSACDQRFDEIHA